jgi:Protein of unknown function (DUF3489)
MKLTDSQLVILSTAAKRADGSILPLPKSVKLNKGAATLVLKSLLKHKLVAEEFAQRETECWREDGEGQRFALSVTPAGMKAVGIDDLPEPGPDRPAKADVQPRKPRPVASKKKPEQAVRKRTKLSVLVDLLSRKAGATIEEAAKATGWQHHSVRGAISGALKKKMGLEVTSAPVEGRGRVYRVAKS